MSAGLKCSACGEPLSVQVVEGRKYYGLCSVCGLEHVLVKKERFLVGDEVCAVKECRLDNKITATVVEISPPDFIWGTTWMPMSYTVLFKPGAYGNSGSCERSMSELDIARVVLDKK